MKEDRNLHSDKMIKPIQININKILGFKINKLLEKCREI